ncbi:thioredoxin family protein [Streptomyces sp. NPDC006487]|uniref:thioredoxin family protein n=1 Tax=Streptomyces sp. NPDC006487 TaxID=3364748 RepID=UPI0036CFAAB0
MAAHRRHRTSRIPGFVRFSAVSLTVAGAAFASAQISSQTRSGGTESVAAAVAPDTSTAQAPADPQALNAGAAPVDPSTAGPAPSAAASASAPSAPAAPAAAVPAAAAATTPARQKAAAKAAVPSPKSAKPDTGAAPKTGSGSGHSGFTAGYDEGSDGSAAVKEALTAAAADGKKVLIDFGSNGCGNCRAADKVFGGSTVGAVLDASYHVVKVDISAGFEMLTGYCPAQKGKAYAMPVLVVLNSKGEVTTQTYTTGNPKLTNDGLGAFLRQWA